MRSSMSTREENRTKIMKMIQETNASGGGGYGGFYIKYKGKEKLNYQQSVGIVLRGATRKEIDRERLAEDK